MVMNERQLAARLTLKDELTPKLKGTERSITSFRTELRRASIQLGLMGAAGSLALRSWIGASEDARGQLNLVASTLKTAGRNAGEITPQLKDMFTALSGESGLKIGDIAKIWLDLADGLGNPEYATQLTKAGTALQVITGDPEAAKVLAGALAGDAGMVESFKKMSGIDLTGFNTEAERFKAVLDGLEPRISENVTPISNLATSMGNLKAALGEGATEQFSGPLNAISGFLDNLAGNDEFVTFAATFTGLATAIGIFGGVLAGTAWLAASHPLVAALIGIAGAASLAFSAGRALGDWLAAGGFGNLFKGGEGTEGGTQTDPEGRGIKNTGESSMHAALRHLLDVTSQSVPHLARGDIEGMEAWLAWVMKDTLGKFPGINENDLRASMEWLELIRRAREQVGMGYVPNEGTDRRQGFTGYVSGMSTGSSLRDIYITVNSDLDAEKRARELLERELQIGAR